MRKKKRGGESFSTIWNKTERWLKGGERQRERERERERESTDHLGDGGEK